MPGDQALKLGRKRLLRFLGGEIRRQRLQLQGDVFLLLVGAHKRLLASRVLRVHARALERDDDLLHVFLTERLEPGGCLYQCNETRVVHAIQLGFGDQLVDLFLDFVRLLADGFLGDAAAIRRLLRVSAGGVRGSLREDSARKGESESETNAPRRILGMHGSGESKGWVDLNQCN